MRRGGAARAVCGVQRGQQHLRADLASGSARPASSDRTKERDKRAPVAGRRRIGESWRSRGVCSSSGDPALPTPPACGGWPTSSRASRPVRWPSSSRPARGVTDGAAGPGRRRPNGRSRRRRRWPRCGSSIVDIASEICTPADAAEFTTELDADCADIERRLRPVGRGPVGLAGKSRDVVSGYGELWSTRLFARSLGTRGKRGPVRWVDARDIVEVQWGPLGPAVQWPVSRERAAATGPPTPRPKR